MHQLRFALGLFAVLPLTSWATAQTVAPSLRLFGEKEGTETFLVDSNGTVVHTWTSSGPPNLGTYLGPDGRLVRAVGRPSFSAPPGGVQMQDLDGTVSWDYRYDRPGVRTHHDIEVMPNGHVLMVARESKTVAEAIAAGRDPALIQGEVFGVDHVIEVQPTGPTTGVIVWEWHMWDHLIQDFDSTKANFGVVGDSPELLDINFPPVPAQTEDFNHTNGIAYDPVRDWIVLSSYNQNEVWIIDHSTTTAEAAGHTGGAHGKGGDLLYRWGNPEAYDRGSPATRRLFMQHAAHIIPAGYPGDGNLLLFNNNPPGGSEVVEITLPLDGSGRFILAPGSAYGPAAPTWSHSGGFNSPIMSSARRHQNGNTLICSGAQGRVFEVTPAGVEVWSQSIGTQIFHAHYVDRRLWSDRTTLALGPGGTASFDLIAGSEHQSQAYLVLGSVTGTSPGITLGGHVLPLNVDSYFFTTLALPNVPPFQQTLGVLDSSGRATAGFALPPGLTVLAGLHFDHAFVVLDPVSRQVVLASNAVPLDLVP